MSKSALTTVLAVITAIMVLAGAVFMKNYPPHGRVAVAPERGGGQPGQPDHAAGLRLVTGVVTMRDRNGTPVSTVPAAVVDGAWLALPARACYGGVSWSFAVNGTGPEIHIKDGLWQDKSPAGLWRLDLGETSLGGPLLFGWDSTRPLDWLPLSGSTALVRNVSVSAPIRQGLFMHATPADLPDQPGVLMQADRVVGWTFGPLLDGAWLWLDQGWEEAGYAATVENFYTQTFANGREERMARAFAMGEESSLPDRLGAAIEALNTAPLLAPDDRPAGLTQDRLERHIRRLLAAALEKGLYTEIARIADLTLLRRLNDPPLVVGVVAAQVRTYGLRDGLQFLDEVTEGFPNLPPAIAEKLLDIRHALLREAMGEALAKSDHAAAWQIFTEARGYFPDDAELHLIGVELALTEFGWQEAEQLLNARPYPAQLQDRARLLAMEIETQRRNEQRIVIRFPPGSKIVPVAASLNDRLAQDFVIDTGASMVVIPSNAVERLGLTIDEDAPLHHVSTAGGVLVARQVRLDSLEIEGWREEDVEALVLDIPGQPDLGLIGMNFLGRFQMDLKNDEGVLLLTPIK